MKITFASGFKVEGQKNIPLLKRKISINIYQSKTYIQIFWLKKNFECLKIGFKKYTKKNGPKKMDRKKCTKKN